MTDNSVHRSCIPDINKIIQVMESQLLVGALRTKVFTMINTNDIEHVRSPRDRGKNK